MPGDYGAIQTFTGKRFYPLAPEPADICVEDICHALSMQCRFTGHCREFYSVAQHSMLVATLVKPATPENVLWALLHDASEAYLIDVARPVKQSAAFAAYREAEAVMQCAVATRFSLPPDMPEAVHLADNVALAIEAREFMTPLLPEWAPFVELDRPEIRLIAVSPQEAERALTETLERALDNYTRVRLH